MEGKIIKDVLSKNGIAQSEIAKRLGITANNLNNMLFILFKAYFFG